MANNPWGALAKVWGDADIAEQDRLPKSSARGNKADSSRRDEWNSGSSGRQEDHSQGRVMARRRMPRPVRDSNLTSNFKNINMTEGKNTGKRDDTEVAMQQDDQAGPHKKNDIAVAMQQDDEAVQSNFYSTSK